MVKPETIMTGVIARVAFLLGTLLLTACAGLPPINAVPAPAASRTVSACREAFPKGKWQFAHVIGATLPGGGEARLMGVTEISQNPARIHAVVMTIEGLVLFDGLEERTLTINRSVAPFDSHAFAKGLMEDIRLMFLAPEGEPVGAGLTRDGFRVCRYRVSGHTMVDVTVRPHGMLEIQKYGNGRLIRKAEIQQNTVSVPEKAVLNAYEPAPYSLNMRLISAEQIKK